MSAQPFCFHCFRRAFITRLGEALDVTFQGTEIRLHRFCINDWLLNQRRLA